MVKTCCVYKCKSRAVCKNHQSTKNEDKENQVSFFRFPINIHKRNSWIRAINRNNWTPSKHTYICSLHFVDGWHSDNPSDVNYSPTLFWYKETTKSDTDLAREQRKEQRNAAKVNKEKEVAAIERERQNKRFSLSCHSYCLLTEGQNEVGTAVTVTEDDVDIHSTCSTATQTDDDPLVTENRTLQRQLLEANEEIRRGKWSTEKVKHNDQLVRFYTGLPTYAVFLWLFNYLLPKAREMSYWAGSETNTTDRQRSSKGILSPIDQFFAVLMRLKLGLFIQDIAERFQISSATFSRYFTTWICLLHKELKPLNVFPSRDIIQRTMPACFKKYKHLRVILDCTEIYIQKSSSLINQNLTFSNYKHSNTFKFLIGITPSEVISFVSEAWGGRVSDRQLTLGSGILELLEPGDSVMADKGFLIADLLQKKGCTLNIPPFMGERAQFTTEQVLQTQEIAKLRIHVERNIGRVKNFHIFDGVLPLSLAPLASQIFQEIETYGIDYCSPQ